MKIVVKLKAIAQTSEIDIHLSELNLTSDEWKKLSGEERERIVNEYVDAENEANSPYLQADSYHLDEDDED